jgi:hypothetical protein
VPVGVCPSSAARCVDPLGWARETHGLVEAPSQVPHVVGRRTVIVFSNKDVHQLCNPPGAVCLPLLQRLTYLLLMDVQIVAARVALLWVIWLRGAEPGSWRTKAPPGFPVDCGRFCIILSVGVALLPRAGKDASLESLVPSTSCVLQITISLLPDASDGCPIRSASCCQCCGIWTNAPVPSARSKVSYYSHRRALRRQRIGVRLSFLAEYIQTIVTLVRRIRCNGDETQESQPQLRNAQPS